MIDIHDPLTIYNIIVCGILLVLAGITTWNLVQFERLADDPPHVGEGAPRVSIMVPARNEERGVEACVRSLCEQQYQNMEVLVLDDGSSDATPEILARLAAEYPDRLRVLQGSPLPPEWVGKSWACHTLSQHATGDVFIFTDADTVHRPMMVLAAIDQLRRTKLDMFSMIPYEEMGTFMEHAVLPMVHVLYFAYLPNDLIHKSKQVSVSAANGQFMCFRREAYHACGGHGSVYNSMVEDVFLAKAAKRAGLRIALVDGTAHVACRMYTSASEVIAGFSKNFFPATSYNLPMTALFIVHLLAIYTAPVVMLAAGLAWPLPLLQLLLAAYIRLAIAGRCRMPWWHSLLQPVTAAFAAFIGINSIRWAYSSTGPRWKGRSYATNRR
jgi:chlorobactene glucosyltransferase